LHLRRLRLQDFKSYEAAAITWGEGVNVLVGDNGSGKTNVLDAIYWLGMGRSRFHRRDVLSVRAGAAGALLETVVAADDEDRTHRIVIPTQGQRRFLIDGQAVPSIREYLGSIPLVMLTPLDQELIRGGREIRRRFFDMLFSRLHPPYLQAIIQYHRLLQQRNRVLKAYYGKEEGRTLAALLDRKIVPLIRQLTTYRQRALSEMAGRIGDFHQALAQRPEAAAVRYHPSIAPEADPAEVLARTASRDWDNGTTTRGPHRDHFEFLINDRPIETASEGQQKTFLVALKMAEWNVLASTRNVRPLLLLDDIFDKLDADRSRRLLDLLAHHGGAQTWITDTSLQRSRQVVGASAQYYSVTIEQGISNIRPL